MRLFVAMLFACLAVAHCAERPPLPIIDMHTQRPSAACCVRAFPEAGFGRRVMFGSDQMTWPGVIERALDVIDSAPFLNEEQKRNILYNNAARFLRLTDAQIAAHHLTRP